MMKRIARTLSGLLVMALAAPAIAAVTDEDLGRAREEINRIQADSQVLGDAVQEAWARQAELESEISRLQSSIEFAQVQIAQTEERLEEVAVELYMGSTSSASLTVLFSSGRDEVGAGLQYLRDVSGVDESVITRLRVFRRELDRQTERLAEASAEEAVVTAELQQMAAQLLEDLGEAQVFYDQLVEQQQREDEERRRREEERRRLEEEQRRQVEARRRQEQEAARHATTTTASTTTSTAAPTTTSTAGGESSDTTVTVTVTVVVTTTAVVTTTTTLPPSSGNGFCPVAGPVSFSDTWGAPRSGGRRHQGVDMIAARGIPIVAIYGAVIKRISVNNLGGNSLWLRADNGDEFYYAHMDSYGDISVGQRVPQGYVVGYNGSSGNAPDWIPHLHLEWHPGGGAAVNPYPLVRSLCG